MKKNSDQNPNILHGFFDILHASENLNNKTEFDELLKNYVAYHQNPVIYSCLSHKKNYKNKIHKATWTNKLHLLFSQQAILVPKGEI